ncbi:hypothetical protein [Azospirillum palustre]
MTPVRIGLNSIATNEPVRASPPLLFRRELICLVTKPDKMVMEAAA